MTPDDCRRFIRVYPVTLLYLCVMAAIMVIIALTDATK